MPLGTLYDGFLDTDEVERDEDEDDDDLVAFRDVEEEDEEDAVTVVGVDDSSSVKGLRSLPLDEAGETSMVKAGSGFFASDSPAEEKNTKRLMR